MGAPAEGSPANGYPRTVGRRRYFLLAAVAVALVLHGVPSAAAQEARLEYPGGAFSDDNGSIHEANIEAIAAAGITTGCVPGEHLYCPADEVTRAQMASFLARALDLPAAEQDYFSDDDGNFHEASINALRLAGITRSCRLGPDHFCPRDPVSRAQMASFLARALTLLAADEDYFRDDDGNFHEASINALRRAEITRGCRLGPDHFCPRDPVSRAQMASFLARALGLEPIEPVPVPWRLELVVDRIEGGTTDLQAPAGDDRLFLVLKDGLIRVISEGALEPEPFLDIRDLVRKDASERGMLGMAFHPDYAGNGRFFVFYTDLDGHSQVYEYLVDAADGDRADPATARQIITFEQRPTSPTHKGGQLQFGADGHLYIAVGDGGGIGDPFGHGQDSFTELGTIVRIDVDRGDPYAIPPGNPFADGVDGLGEIWAYGLRNPWRFSFDDGLIYIGDVGQAAWEEVNVADASTGGINYGWSTMEGPDCLEGAVCDPAGLFLPQVAYDRDNGISVIGGYVYRGSAIPEMVGRYFYSDFRSDWIRTFVYDGALAEHYDWSRAVSRPRFVWSFGVDGHGELYVLGRWEVWKVVPAD